MLGLAARASGTVAELGLAGDAMVAHADIFDPRIRTAVGTVEVAVECGATRATILGRNSDEFKCHECLLVSSLQRV